MVIAAAACIRAWATGPLLDYFPYLDELPASG
jgi:hypothetical protein